MINYEEELKNYKPSVDISRAEDTIQQSDISDIMDVIEDILKRRPAPAGGKNDAQDGR